MYYKDKKSINQAMISEFQLQLSPRCHTGEPNVLLKPCALCWGDRQTLRPVTSGPKPIAPW